MTSNAGWLGLLCLAAAAATFALAPGPDDLRLALSLFVLIGGLWMTQALPLPVTALLVPVLAATAGLQDVRAALAPFAHPIIFLFLGGFALAAALQRQGIDRALAHAMLSLAGGHRLRVVVMLCGLTAALSMWISNTATAAMMLPLALGLLQGNAGEVVKVGEVGEAAGAGDAGPAGRETTAALGPREQVFVLLALAYSASIGGIATLVGSPPNAIAAAQTGIGFADWLAFGLPAAMVLWPVMMGVLWLLLRPALHGTVLLRPLRFEWSRERLATVAIFGFAVVGWIGGAPAARLLGVGADMDTVVALVVVVVLVATGSLRWGQLEAQAQWGILLLFGGGLALSGVMQSSGASRFLAEQALSAVAGAPPVLVVMAVIAFVVFVTELVSNTASAALVLPILLPAAAALGLSEQVLAAAVAIAASCAFMLPVATPPNAIVFGTERVPQRQMMWCGWWLNLVCILVLTALASIAPG